jgi:hypothetical protein
MPATTIGTSGVVFGLTSETGGVVQSFSETRNVEKAEVRNQTGEVTGLAFYNPTDTYSINLITTAANTATAGASITISNAASSGGSTRIDSITVNRTNTGFNTVDISATRYPSVT